METQNKDRKLNVVVVGRSGVGKSSFLNYAAGEQKFETGKGDPVTQSYFDEIDVVKPEQKVTYCLFDTKGLEAGNIREWEKAVFTEIDKRDKSDNIYDWFHTIIFCIDASSRRIQPFEVEAIKKLEKKGSVLVLLTKKDLVSPEILEKLRQQVIEDIGRHVQVLSVCSVATRTRKGTSETSGLENVLRVSFLGLWQKAAKVLPAKVLEKFLRLDLKLKLGNRLGDLLAFYALSESMTSYPSYSALASIGGMDMKVLDNIYYDNKEVPSYLGLFRKISKETGIPYEDQYLTIKGNFDRYIHMPNKLSHSFLDYGYYTSSIRNYVGILMDILKKVLENLRFGTSVSQKVSEQQAIIKEILKFYKDITGEDVRHVDDSATKRASHELEEYKKFTEVWDEIHRQSENLYTALNNVDSCVFISGDERRDAENFYIDLRNTVKEFVHDLKVRVNNFRDSYTAELHLYGEYCLREDELSGNEKTDKYEVMRTMIKGCLADGVITPKEYNMIRMVAETQGISDMKVIDDLIAEVKNGIK